MRERGLQGGKVLARRKEGKEGGRRESARGRVAGWEDSS